MTNTKQGALAVSKPAPLAAFEDNEFDAFAGDGLENVTAKDVLIPRLGILQSLSPQLRKSKPEYVPGAEEGMICDLGMGVIYPDGVTFLPVYFRKDYLEWAPRDSGRGLVAIHGDPSILNQTTKNDRNQDLLPNGNLIAETFQFFGFNVSGGMQRCFIPMTSTQIKRAKRLLSLATSEKVQRADGSEFTPPLFYRAYSMTSGPEENAQGSWSGWRIERGPKLTELEGINASSLITDCKEFLASLKAGEVRADVSQMDGASDGNSGSEGAM